MNPTKIKKPHGRFTVYAPNGKPMHPYRTLHVKLTSGNETVERILSPRQFIRAYQSKRNKDFMMEYTPGLWMAMDVKIYQFSASITIKLGDAYVDERCIGT